MRLNMNNHFSSNSITADMENEKEDIDFSITKNKGVISKRVYFRVSFKQDKDKAILLLNTEQLEQLAHSLEVYVKSGNYKKRSNAKASDYFGIL